MKLNFILFLVLSSLVGFSYFWEELELKSILISSESNQILNINEDQIKEISFKYTKLNHFSDQWTVGELGYPADMKKIESVLSILTALRSMRTIEVTEGKQEEFFRFHKHTFSLTDQMGSTHFFKLGDYSEVTGEFYLEYTYMGKKKIYLAMLDMSFEGVYRTEKEAEIFKYIKFKDLVESSPEQLMTTKILPQKIISSIKQLDMTKEGVTVEVDVENKTTKPEIPKALVFNDFSSVLDEKFRVKVKKVYRNKFEQLEGLFSQVKINNNETTLSLFKYFDGSKGYFLYNSFYDVIVELDSLRGTIFLASEQDFWKKQFTLLDKLKGKTSFKFSISDMKESVGIEVLDVNSFNYKADGDRGLNTGLLNLVFNILFNSKEFYQSDFIDFEKNFVDERAFKIKVLENEYSFVAIGGIITVYDHSSNIKFTFIGRVKNLKAFSYRDFFTKM